MTDNQYIDLFGLVRFGRQLSGHFSLAQFTRLLKGMPERQTGSEVSWSLEGRTTAAGESLVELDVQATLTLECQRCLQPFDRVVQVHDVLQVVASEDEIKNDDLEIDDLEQVVGSEHFDLLALLEDELILEVPYIPRHEQCHPESLALHTPERSDDLKRPNPFAVLGRLKKS